MPALTAAGPGPRPLLRLRPAEQRPHPALPGRVGPPLPRGGPADDRRPGAALPVRRRPGGRRRRPRAAGGRVPGRDRRRARALAAYGCEGWPSLFLWGQGGALRLVSLRRGRVPGDRGGDPGRAARARRAARAAAADGAAAAHRRPRRAGDGADARGLPGRLWERPWIAGEDGEALELDYEAGGAFATVEGGGEIAVEIDGEAGRPVAVDGAGSLRAGRAPAPRGATRSSCAPPRPARSGRSASPPPCPR